jgi:hypothetical protein
MESTRAMNAGVDVNADRSLTLNPARGGGRAAARPRAPLQVPRRD